MRYIVLYIILTCALFANSQTYNIEHYTVKDGLSHAFVNDIIQDNRGNLWIATGGGLAKFDGVDFESYTTKDGLNFYRLLCVAQDQSGNIWVGTSKGINVYNGDSIYTSDKIQGNILALETSSNGYMWTATKHGIYKVRFENKNIHVQELKHQFKNAKEINIFQERDNSIFLLESQNKLFIGINNTVYVHEDGIIEPLKIAADIKAFSACKIDEKNIVFGTNQGLYKYFDHSFKKLNHPFLKDFDAYKIKCKDHKFWMIGQWHAQTDDELYLVSIDLDNDKYFRKISARNGLIDNPTSIFIDHENNIWTGSNGGLSVLKGESFVNYSKSNGLIGNKIWGVHQDWEENIWVGTINQGLSIIDQSQIRNFTNKDGLPDMYISSIQQINKQELLIGTGKKGLCKATKSGTSYRFEALNIDLNRGTTRIDDILIDKDNTIWVASSKGLYYSKDHKSYHHLSLTLGDTGQIAVQKILLSSDNKLYIGTKRDGLFVYSNNTMTQPISENNDVISICEDSDGQIWVGSQNKGIRNLSNKTNPWITEFEGLKSTLIYILQSDPNGYIWIGSNLGLDKLNSKLYNQNHQIEIQHYDTDDGLHELEMNLNGSIEDHDGNLWFATNDGLLKYDYRYDISNRTAPIVSLTNIKLHSNEIDWSLYSDSLNHWNRLPIQPKLPYDQNHITFNFVGISFKNPKKIRYSWQLEGFDEQWVPSSSNREVTYSNLPPGNYIFKLKASNNDGVWSSEDFQFKFTIKAPFWKELWFIISCIAAIILAIYLFFTWRMRSLNKRQRELKILVKERTHKISLQKEELLSQRDAIFNQKEQLESAHRHLSDSINYAKKIQDSILPNKDILETYFSDSFILYKPKDNVSGDFYWWTHIEDHTVVTAADCTGHGVPGAFMSMLGTSLLREIVQKEYITHTGVILRKLRKEVIKSLKQKGKSGEQKDGMDMAIISVNHETKLLQYSGANNPLYIITHNGRALEGLTCLADFPGFYEIKPDKMPIAIYERMDTFKTHEIQLEKGDQVYMFSDGYADQFGGPRGKKFKYKPFKKLLFEHADQKMALQNKALDKAYEAWKGYKVQIDDVVIVGIKI